MKNRINFLGMREIEDFVRICSTLDCKIELFCPSNNYRVSAKSMLGGLATMDWSEVWIESELDIYSKIEKYIVLGNDTETIHH